MVTQVTWKKLAVGAAVATGMMVGAAFVGARFAMAVPGGETRNALSFAGTLRNNSGAPVTSATPLTFTFRKGGTMVCAPSVTVTPDSAGAFVAQIPTDGCPRSLFDGGDVTFDVASGGNVIASNQAVNPVPYARYADTVGTPDCPATYTRDTSASSIILCRRGNDEVVRVGDGNSAFWIDRYEASVWSDRDGTRGVLDSPNTPFGAQADDYPSTFPDNGQVTRALFAASRVNVIPSRFITWLQAVEACASSGKRLPTNEEWQRAARGTFDPGIYDGASGSRCNTRGGVVRATGRGARFNWASGDAGPQEASCESGWGAQDMIGNVAEIVAEWHFSPGTTSVLNAWGAGFNGDVSYYIASGAESPAGFTNGLPAVLYRGGNYNDGVAGGIFKIEASSGPNFSGQAGGFRCVIPR